MRELRELKKRVGALKSGRAADDIKEELVQYASRPEKAFDAHRALALGLKEFVQSYPKVTVWDHRRLWRRNPDYFAPDGLHLSDLGNLQFYNSVRGALDRQLKHI
ncbi:hypothetical protein Bbelb_316850 [Branchiostoma belcheri]|nr:hypothetical protein Bbelb_316850 [Branchiostoma belcheri]